MRQLHQRHMKLSFIKHVDQIGIQIRIAFVNFFLGPFHKTFAGFKTKFAFVQHLLQQRARLMAVLQMRKDIGMDIPCELCADHV